jgi:branched-chain amino acid aminotransferase
VTGTVAEITPIISVDNHVVGSGLIGNVTKQISGYYNKVVFSQTKEYNNWLTAVW